MSDCRYWLARRDGDTVRLVDGCHNGAEDVARSAKLHARLFGDRGPWVMVEIHDLPDLDAPINDSAAETCAALVESVGHRRPA